jgi:monothiol glutaredoxin
MNESTRQRIDEMVKGNKVVLFMKGSRHAPQCGFSATVVQILDRVIPDYQTVDVLRDPEIREGIKEYSAWPTIPQLYVRGEFQGGCDIVREMYQSGELEEMLR